MSRLVIHIDRNLCDGCGNCITACTEDVLAIHDGKVHLIDDAFCDGFGQCIHVCPAGALTLKARKYTCRN